ncbi:MAG: PadR family transcriptional regulator [Proteobacteria bacterium]|nr:PadR family transcriptional regulator [Pseudomonadota bacterium]MBU1387046.1 PadR family transcriptional regulator [Pseudomonadota bacterium]MBU1542273.1 PadR family transcriptional regulator [Pseudomonadota bacterium]
MQDKILLGFLMDGEKTGYEIKKLMENSTSFFFNTSLGSIYPAFGKLEKMGYVKMDQVIGDGRVKKRYSITQEGRKHFREWLAENVSLSKIRDDVLLKMFFFSELSVEKRCEQICSYIDQLKKQADTLTALKEKLMQYDVDKYMLKTLDYGIDYYLFTHDWYKRLLETLEDEK